VLFWHSSSYKLPPEVEQENVGNVFKLLPLMKRGDLFYIVTKDKGQFTVHQYKVNDKQIVEPTEVGVIDQNIVGHQATLITCYPIGTYDQRYIVKWLPVSTMENLNYDQLLDVLNVWQEVELRSIAQDLKNKNPESDRQLLINSLQQARKSVVNQHQNTIEQKQRKDAVWQYLMYHINN
jgi:hypothetical protein